MNNISATYPLVLTFLILLLPKLSFLEGRMIRLKPILHYFLGALIIFFSGLIESLKAVMSSPNSIGILNPITFALIPFLWGLILYIIYVSKHQRGIFFFRPAFDALIMVSLFFYLNWCLKPFFINFGLDQNGFGRSWGKASVQLICLSWGVTSFLSSNYRERMQTALSLIVFFTCFSIFISAFNVSWNGITLSTVIVYSVATIANGALLLCYPVYNNQSRWGGWQIGLNKIAVLSACILMQAEINAWLLFGHLFFLSIYALFIGMIVYIFYFNQFFIKKDC